MEDNVASIFEITCLKNPSVDSDDQFIFIEGSLPGLSSCPRCGGTHLHRQTKNQRFIHLPPVGLKRAKLQVNVQKQCCVKCKHSWWPSVSLLRNSFP